MIEFSVIIPLYNKETTILKTLDSVLAQTYPHFEVVVVDDGSTDRSAELVTSLADSRIRYFKKENGGPSSARNLGVEKAEKEWLLFLDADDLLLGNALETFEKVIARTEGAGIFAANFYWVKKQAKWLYAKDYPEGGVRNPYKDWFLHRLMPRAGACVIQKGIASDYPYKEYLRRSEDTDVMFDMMRNHPVYRISVPVMEYRLDDATESKIRRGIGKDFQGHLSFDRWKPLWERICLYELYVEAKNNYPDEVHGVYPDMGKRVFLKAAYHAAFRYRAFLQKRRKK